MMTTRQDLHQVSAGAKKTVPKQAIIAFLQSISCPVAEVVIGTLLAWHSV